ncbi:TolC family protein [Comamonas testosteroni]|uniref:TolC family protein n=1 Tax=Comamonas testosteroni TaxID=285 RepID=UPI00265F8C90|nr:TolC family protein [Comamonas testosteroni]WKL14003.1 TolC family protein [Comamonas testosteroni]
MQSPFLSLKRLALLLAALGLGGAALAQAAAQPAAAGLRFIDYLNAVEQHSLDLQSEQQNVVSAQAGIGIAGIRPDPQLSLGAAREQVSSGLPRPLNRTYELSMELETGGKRSARIRAARSQVKLAEAGVEGFRTQLFSDAAQDFTQACRDRQALERKEQTLKALSDVVKANEVRRKAGDIGTVEWRQSRVERDQFQADVTQARADAQTSRLALSVPLGRKLSEVFGSEELQCDFQPFANDKNIEALVVQALQVRSDVRVAQATLENARDNAGVAQANRWVNPTLAVGMTAIAATSAGVDVQGNAFDAGNRSRMLSVSVSMPIPFSRLNRGEVLQAEAVVTQAMLGLQQSQHKAEAGVRSAYFRFAAAQENVERYRSNVLADAQRVLESIRLSYRHGQASLLELLSAQRSADDAYLGYLQADADLAKATVDLQLSIGQRPAL